MGEPVTFLLQASDGQPADAAAFLDAVCHTLQTETSVHAAAQHVYRPLSVYVSLLDDPDAEPASAEDEMEALPDEWPPLHLALVMEHTAAAAALLGFHQQHAFTVLEHALSENNRVASSRAAAEGSSAPCKGFEPAQEDVVECQVVNDLGGTIVLFSGQESGDAQHVGPTTASADANEPVCSVPWVTTVLRPFLQCLFYERSHSAGRGTQAKKEVSPPGLAARIIQEHCEALPEFCVRFPGLIVQHDVLYEVCRGDLVALLDLLDACCGLLLPVLHGTRLQEVGGSLHGTPSHATGREASHGGSLPRGCCPQTAAPPPFLLPFKPQEHQRLAFLVTWANYRDGAVVERKPPGSARKSQEASVLSNFRVTLLNLKRSGCVVPANSVWSGLIFVLSRLISRDCYLERFLDIIEEENFVSCSCGMPV
ncbi:acyl-CoA binding protein, partial [Trypanosoma conorhini]